jgi:cellobiose phosphorylase
LAKEHDRIVLLFTPPFDHSQPHPGYIMGYPPGIRENGGQYTHGSLWLAMAWARLGEGDRAVRLLQMMNPVEHCRTPQDVERYKGEPYVSAGDVYASPLQTGQSGWTWYSGSSAWMYRIWLEEVLGFELRGQSFTLRPMLPANWPEFKLTYRHANTTYNVSVMRTSGAPQVEMDGSILPDDSIPLRNDGAAHTVIVHVNQVRRSTPLIAPVPVMAEMKT